MDIKGYEDTLRWYKNNATTYAKKTKNNSENDKQQLDQFASLLPPHGNVLDAGCGSGRDTSRLQEKGFHVTGLDITRNLIKEAKKNYPHGNFIEGDMLQLPFEDETYDGVWAHASLVHFDQDEQINKTFSEIYRVLKKGGVLHVLVRAQKGEKREITVDSISRHERFYRNFTQDELRTLIENNGMNVFVIHQYDESKLDPNKRPGEGIKWILALAKKIR